MGVCAGAEPWWAMRAVHVHGGFCHSGMESANVPQHVHSSHSLRFRSHGGTVRQRGHTVVALLLELLRYLTQRPSL